MAVAEIEFPTNAVPNVFPAPDMAADLGAEAARVAVISHAPAALRSILFGLLSGEARELPPIRAD